MNLQKYDSKIDTNQNCLLHLKLQSREVSQKGECCLSSIHYLTCLWGCWSLLEAVSSTHGATSLPVKTILVPWRTWMFYLQLTTVFTTDNCLLKSHLWFQSQWCQSSSSNKRWRSTYISSSKCQTKLENKF